MIKCRCENQRRLAALGFGGIVGAGCKKQFDGTGSPPIAAMRGEVKPFIAAFGIGPASRTSITFDWPLHSP
jgi:hypothetical protein